MTSPLRRLVLAAALLTSGATARAGETLDIYFIDVMGGAATLIVTPERESILIDSGWPGLEDRDSRRIVRVLKDVAGCDHLDHLITTHWHMDHFGGVDGLSKLVTIKKFWDRGLPDSNAPDGDRAAFPDGPKADDPLGIAYRKASEGKREALAAGRKLTFAGGLEAVVLASGGKVAADLGGADNPLCADAPPDLPDDPSDNAHSLSFRFRFGKFDFLDCGDLTWNVEKKLVCPKDLIGPIDLFQVTHHGAANSNHPTLVKTIAPTVTVMNNGTRKGGDPPTVKLLKSVPSVQAAYQLHMNMATGAANTDPGLIANSLEGGQFIHVSVTAGGKTFTVRMEKEGSGKTFDSK